MTHVVSEHETVQQSIRALCTETSDWKENTLVLKSSWLSECIKAGRLVDVQQQHCLPLGRATSEVCNYYGFQFCNVYGVCQADFQHMICLCFCTISGLSQKLRDGYLNVPHKMETAFYQKKQRKLIA